MNGGELQKKNKPACVVILMLASLIWGFAFVAQRKGADYVGPFTFLAVRNWIAGAFLMPVLVFLAQHRKKKGLRPGVPTNGRQWKMYLLAGSACGTALFLASGTQQIAIPYTTTAKAGFITALYVLFVPVISFFLGRRPAPSVWACVAVGLVGLYLLCLKPGEADFNHGDVLLVVCSLLFSVQILTVNNAVQYVDAVWLSFLEVISAGVLGTISMLLFEHPTAAALRGALPSLLFAGVMSSGVAYTFQIVGQEGLDPTVASLIMCLESVFSALGGWIFLGQGLTLRELTGCALMFGAIVLSQLPAGFGGKAPQ